MAGNGYGYVKISRKAYQEDPFWNERRVFSKWEAWEDMIQMAAWKDHSRVIGNTPVHLRRGEFLGSFRFLATRWGWGTKKVRLFLELCTELGRLSVRDGSKKGHIYLLVNYGLYQHEGHAEGTAGAQQGHSRGTNKKKEEEGRRREIEEVSSSEDTSAEPPNGSTPPVAVMEFPTVGKGPKSWRLTEAKLAEYRQSYPGLDVPTELRKARQWCIDNARRRKTASGMPAFLANWLNKATDRPRSARGADEDPYPYRRFGEAS